MAYSAVSSATNGVGNAILAANQGLYAPFLLDNDTSPFDYSAWRKVRNSWIERIDVSPNNGSTTVAPGATADFMIPKQADHLGPCQLRVSVTGIGFGTAGQVGNGSEAYAFIGCIGGAAYAMLEDINVQYIANSIQRFTGDDIFLWDSLTKGMEMRPALHARTGFEFGLLGIDDIGVNANKSATGALTAASLPPRQMVVYQGNGLGAFTDASTTTIAATQRDYIIDLPLFWTYISGMYLPYSPLSADLHIKIKFAAQTQWLFTNRSDLASTVSLTVALRVTYVHLTDAQRDELESAVNGSDHGIVYKTVEWQKAGQATISAAATSYRYAIGDINGAVTAGYVQVRPKAGVKGQGGVDGSASTNYYDRTPYITQAVDSYYVQAGNGKIWPDTDHLYAVSYLLPTYHSQKALMRSVYPFIFSANPENTVDSRGHLDFGNVNNPTVVLTAAGGLYGVGSYTNVYVDCQALVHQLIQVRGGEISKVFV